VRESFKTFQEQFQRTSEDSIRDRATLLEQVRSLQETQGKLSAEANSLTRALTGDSRTQGDFGEAVLERLLEAAGLQQGVHFDLQLNHVNDEGRNRRPDALVYLPGDRAIVIDSKCSLTAFTASARAISQEEREMDLKAHLESMRAHVKELCRKDYTSVLKQRSPDFVLMFVPSEAAFQTAISRDPAIVDDAYRASRVVICSPTTVLATLQMVHHVWRTERQTTHSQRIAEEAGKMVDKLAGVIEAFSRVGAQLDLAQSALGEAKLRLSTGKGSLLSLANKVTALGARAKTEKLAAANRQVALEVEVEAENAAEAPQSGPPQQGQFLLDASLE
jgi:DNA recombination protein RmuC